MSRVFQGLWRSILALAFRLLYNELAWTYDAVSYLVSLGEWRSWQRAAMPFLRGSQILELAHGPGHMLVELEKAGYQVAGIDLSLAMGRLARSRLRRSRVAVPLVRGKAQGLPFCRGAFDSVLVTFPAEFIVDRASILSLYRVIRPGGRVVIVFQASLLGRGPLRRFLEWLYSITGQRAEQSDHPGQSPLWLEAWQRYESASFHVQFEHVQLEKSQVSIVLAIKRE